MSKKILTGVLAGITLLSIHSSAKAVETEKNIQINPVISNNGQPINITYQSKTEMTAGTKLIGSIFSKIAETNIGGSLPSSYIPEFKDKLNIKNQLSSGEDTYECWANALVSAYEAYNNAKNLTIKDKEFSARHINYSSNNVFKDQTITSKAYNRNAQTAQGGNITMALNYSTSGKGPVLESDMPSTGKVTGINYSELKTENGTQVSLNNYIIFPTIYKQVQNTGEIKYFNNYNMATNVFSNEISNIESFRNTIKEQIKTNGGVMANIFQVEGDKDVYVPQIKIDGKMASANHAVLIIGWDDNYMPTDDDIQVPTGTTWKNKGAYIALNSYGENNYYDGFIYISYDDFFVEQAMSGITKAAIPTYTNTYLNDELGCTMEYSIDSESASIVNIFERTSNEEEEILQIGIPSFRKQKADIYYTEQFENGVPINFRPLLLNIELVNGYKSFNIGNAPVTKNKFAICVTYISEDDYTYIPVEMEKNNIVQIGNLYDYAVVNEGESYLVYSDPSTGEFDYTTSRYTYENLEYNTILFNAGIRAYTGPKNETTSGDIRSDSYIIKDNIITRVPVNTTIDEFKTHIITNRTYEIVDKNGNELNTKLVRTGYILKAGTEEYIISVVSDISGSGGDEYARALDIAKMRAHLVELRGSILTGAKLESADINGNGNVDIVDLLKLREICVQ